ncbi:MAG: hypothetical protein ACP5QK_12620 [Myxococcota bacterium]
MLTLIASLFDADITPIKVVTIRFIVSGIIGVGLWYIKGWSAGDAKLFWLLSLAFQIEGTSPISIFNETFVFLINIFLPIIPVLLFSLLYDYFKRMKLKNEGVRVELRGVIKNIMTVLTMMLISRVIYINFFSHLPQGKYNLISMLLVFFIMSSISKIFRNIRMYMVGGIILLINIIMLYIHLGKAFFSQIYAIGTLALIVIIFRIFYESVLKYLDVEIVRLEKLRVGDSLSKDFIVLHNLDKGELAERMGNIFMDGLTKEQLDILVEHLSSKGLEYVERQRTFSFSIYIVIGYAFTYFTDFENMIIFIKRLSGI